MAMPQPQIASFPSASGAAQAAPSGLRSPWHSAGEVLAAGGFEGATAKAQHEAFRRWYWKLPKEQRHPGSGRLMVHDDARLPNNLTVQACIRVPEGELLAGHRLPADTKDWNDRDRQRFLDTWTLLDAWDQYRAAQPTKLAEELIADFAAAQAELIHVTRSRLSVDLRRLREYRRRVTPGDPCFNGNVDRRGSGARIAVEISDGAWELFRSLYLHKNRLPLKACWAFVQGESEKHGWIWPATPGPIARKVKQLPPDSLVLARMGPKVFEASCVPKTQRDIESIMVGEWWSLDCRKLDFHIRVPDSRKEWRSERLVFSGVADVRMRGLKIDLRSTENSDGVAAVSKLAFQDWGAPLDMICDQGSAYDSLLATLDKEELDRIDHVFATFGVRVHRAIPYHPWAKPIESMWKRVKEMLDRWLWQFWGGSPGERPEGQAKEVKTRIDDLPTIEQVREQVITPFLEEWHATPISGMGTRGLSPNLIREQYTTQIRRVDPALLEAECRKKVGPVRRGRQGFRLLHTYYGQTDEAVWMLPAGQYYLGIDPDRFDRVIVMNADGKHLCEATNKYLSGTTQEHRREAASIQRQYRGIMKRASDARDYLRETPAQQVLEAKARHARAREDELRKSLPEPMAPAVTLVRPDLVESARKVAEQSRRNDRRAGAFEPATKPGRRGFERLAQKAIAEEQEQSTVSSTRRWANLNYDRVEETA